MKETLINKFSRFANTSMAGFNFLLMLMCVVIFLPFYIIGRISRYKLSRELKF